MTPTVYVLHSDSRKNVTSALDYGSLEEVLPETVNPGPENMPRIVSHMEHALRNYTAKDWLILTGSPIAIAVGVAICTRKVGQRLQLLKWDQQTKRYFPAVINLSQRG